VAESAGELSAKEAAMGTAVIKLPSETGAVISSSCSPKFALGMHVTISVTGRIQQGP
jgi:hypothetical protein